LQNTFLSYDKFARWWGVSEGSQGKSFKEWADLDKELWQDKIRKKVIQRPYLGVNYLASENVLYVRPKHISPYFCYFKNKDRIYQETVAGEILAEEVQLRVYSRVVVKLGWCLTVALYWNNGKVGDDEQEEFKILCDFPLAATQTPWSEFDGTMEDLGFKVTHSDSISGNTDEFGDLAYMEPQHFYELNGVRIDCVS
jgi:hypothetical protein